jgi:predicted MFS family arabinose efflux permease
VATASIVSGLLGAFFGWRLAIGMLAVTGLLLGVRGLLLPAPELHEIKARRGGGNWPAFLLLLVATTFMGMVYRGIATFLPKFFAVSYAEDATVGTAIGGTLTTVALLVGLAGMFVAGKLIDRGFHSATVFLIGAFFQIPFLLVIGVAGGGALVPLFMGVAFFHFFTQPAGNHLVADFTPPRMRGLGYGVYFLMTFGAGSFGASIGGWVSKNLGLHLAFPVFAGVLLPSIAAILLVRWVTGRGSRSPAE